MSWRIAIIIIMLGGALGGCAPKRVTSSGVAIKNPAPQVKPEPDPAPIGDNPVHRTDSPELPDPKPLSRSGKSTLPSGRPAPTPLGPRAVDLARAQMGKPYQWGAAGPDKFDCSGLVQYVYSNLGVSLPRVSGQQAGAGVHVDRADLRGGDLVFFRLSGSRINHVGIYVGKGKFIHAPRKHSPVRMDSLNDSWWRGKFMGGRRVG